MKASPSLFNDGVGVVLFLTVLGFVTRGGDIGADDVVALFAREARRRRVRPGDGIRRLSPAREDRSCAVIPRALAITPCDACARPRYLDPR
jgi:hypothetical protein